MKIHVIGDSHTQVFVDTDPFQVCYIPGATAHNLISEKSKTNSNKILLDYINKIDKENDYVILVFGEIDCRFHFNRIHLKNGTPITELMSNTLERYSKIIDKLINMGYCVAIFNVVPAGNWERIAPDRAFFGYSQPLTAKEIMIPINSEFHKMIIEMCTNKGYKIIDIWDHIIDDTGFTKEEYVIPDPIHLNKKIIPIIIANINKTFGLNLRCS